MPVTSGAPFPDRPPIPGTTPGPNPGSNPSRGRAAEAALATADGGTWSNAPSPDYDTLYRQAAHELYQKLAFVSAAIWAVGCVILFILLAAGSDRPIFGAAMAMTLPLIPAAIPWPVYPLAARRLAARRLRAQAAPRS
ncbi:MAG: hypothetical protein IT305_07320 [Chloroflexi bacterium]|nr:hypothetical protein [Chloroflexota bacterium]